MVAVVAVTVAVRRIAAQGQAAVRLAFNSPCSTLRDWRAQVPEAVDALPCCLWTAICAAGWSYLIRRFTNFGRPGWEVVDDCNVTDVTN
jgi:hypothetical protein